MNMLTTLTYLSAIGGVVALIYAVILAVRINKMDSGTKKMKRNRTIYKRRCKGIFVFGI